ncbi:MAG: C39 family peptidase [Bacteroidetes bacterium]|nr:C39 family peptidase [Bacteroidota bacterium]
MKAIWVVLVALTAFSGMPQPKRPPIHQLQLCVPIISQHSDELCWAGCTEMVMRYFRDSSWNQCSLARENYILYYTTLFAPPTYRDSMLADTASIMCHGDSVPDQYNMQGYPFFVPYLASMNVLPKYALRSPSSCPWDTILAAIDRNQPVIFQWNAGPVDQFDSAHAGSHFMVADGYATTEHLGTSRWVSINDTWPQSTFGKAGQHAQIAYNNFNYTSRSYSPWSNGAIMNSKGAVYIVGLR